MRITMQKAESLTREQMREFLAASEELDFALARRTEIYDLVGRTLRRQRYLELTKKDKGVVRRYLAKLSGRSLPQITRLIRQYRQSGAVRVSQPRRRRFPTRYTADDIALLAAVDAAHEGLSGPAVRHILWREYTVYNKAAYQRLASISASHIYNLRRTAAYRQHHVHHTKTRSRGVSIGERRKPDPRGQPGYLRRHGASGRHPDAPGALPHQRRRYARSGRSLLRDHLGSPFNPGFRGHPAPVSFPVRGDNATGSRNCCTSLVETKSRAHRTAMLKWHRDRCLTLYNRCGFCFVPHESSQLGAT